MGLLLTFLAMTVSAQAQQYQLVHFSTGTGFFISRDSYLLTNAHVIRDCHTSPQVLGAGLQTEAEIIWKDDRQDVALLRTRETPISAAVFRSSNLPMQAGDPVVVVGHPLGNGLTTRTAEFIANSGPLGEPQWLRFSNSVFKGNSGGPLLDGSGQVIGMITAKATTYRYNDNAQSEVVANADVAIQPYVLEELLSSQGIRLNYGDNGSIYEAHRVEDRVRDFVVQIKCQLD